jgi:hypothetical protein
VEQRRLEVVVEEIGPSLAWVTAVVTRTAARPPAGSGVGEMSVEPADEIEGAE